MKYHTGRRFGLSEEVQSLIYWTCVSYKLLEPQTQHIIFDAVQSVGGNDASTLFAAVTTKDTVVDIANRSLTTQTPIEASQLARKVRRVYIILSRDLPQVKKIASGRPLRGDTMK